MSRKDLNQKKNIETEKEDLILFSNNYLKLR